MINKQSTRKKILRLFTCFVHIMQVANFGDKDLNLDINVVGLSNHGVRSSGSMQTTFKGELTAENSFDDPKKVILI